MDYLKDLLTRLTNPEAMVKFHGWQSLGWFILAFPICIFLANSIPVIVFVSVLALVLAEFSAWQAARTERLQEAFEKEVREHLNRIEAKIDKLIWESSLYL